MRYGDKEKEISGGEYNTTNNRMELTAAIEALECLKESCEVELYTDSQYLQRGITEWLPQWKRQGWIRKRGKIKNEDLWRRLYALTTRHDISWHWVKGHVGVDLNERCDMLAGQEIQKMRQKKE